MAHSADGTRRSARSKLALAFGSTAVLVLAAELGLAWFAPQATWDRTWNRPDGGTPHEPDDVLPFRLKPGGRSRLVTSEFDTEIRINSRGTRGAEFELEPGAGPRILAVGDSFTYGWGVDGDDAWPARLETELREATGVATCEVINAGFAAGLGPATYYLFLESRGYAWKPDLVLVGFFLGNDVEFHGGSGENLEWAEVDEAGLPTRIRRGHRQTAEEGRQVQLLQRRYRYPVLRNSHLFQALASAFRRWKPVPADYNRFLYGAEWRPRTRERVERVETLFRAMRDSCEERGVALAVVLIPAREQVLPEAYDFAAYGGRDAVDLEKPQRHFREFFQAEGIECLDLLPAFASASERESTYFPIDLHWTPTGTALAAREIRSFVVARELASAGSR